MKDHIDDIDEMLRAAAIPEPRVPLSDDEDLEEFQSCGRKMLEIARRNNWPTLIAGFCSVTDGHGGFGLAATMGTYLTSEGAAEAFSNAKDGFQMAMQFERMIQEAGRMGNFLDVMKRGS